jgi:hypothetical protein
MDILGLVADQKTVTETMVQMGTLGMVMEMVTVAMAVTVMVVGVMVVMGAVNENF